MKNSYEEISRQSLDIERDIKYPEGRQARGGFFLFFLNVFIRVLTGVTDGYIRVLWELSNEGQLEAFLVWSGFQRKGIIQSSRIT